MLPYDMFNVDRTMDEARRAEKLANIYHKGQTQAWEGKQVLRELISKHGGVNMSAEQKGALTRIFSILMWGELAAWKISAQLADRIPTLEAKMAATSQVFDEARHFYVLHDYLVALNNVPTRPDKHTEAALNLVLGTSHLAEKLIGMQMMFEPTALVIFRLVRDLNIEPVLTELLPYFEKDESRHVGLGIQALPEMLDSMGPHEHARIAMFQFRLLRHILASLKHIEGDLQKLGMNTRDVLEAGILKFLLSSDQLLDQVQNNYFDMRMAQEFAKRGVVAFCELIFPHHSDVRHSDRLISAAKVLAYGPRFSASVHARVA